MAYGAAVLVLLHLAMAGAMDTVKPEWRDPEFGHRLYRLRALQAQFPQRPLVVALGSSRTQMGLSPADMGTPDTGPLVFNFGQAGAGPVMMAVNYHRLRNAGIRPDFVLLEYMPAAVIPADPIEVALKPTVSHLSLADVAYLRPYCETRGTLEQDWLATRCNPFSTSRLTLLSHIQPGWLPWQLRQDYQWKMMDAHGWSAYPYDEPPAEVRERSTARTHEQYAAALRDFQVGKAPDRFFRDLLAACRDDGVKAAIYRMPESPMFRSWYTPESWARSEAFVGSLSREWNVPVLDATADFGESDFADGHHMLRGAARRFSRQLGVISSELSVISSERVVSQKSPELSVVSSK